MEQNDSHKFSHTPTHPFETSLPQNSCGPALPHWRFMRICPQEGAAFGVEAEHRPIGKKGNDTAISQPGTFVMVRREHVMGPRLLKNPTADQLSSDTLLARLSWLVTLMRFRSRTSWSCWGQENKKTCSVRHVGAQSLCSMLIR